MAIGQANESVHFRMLEPRRLPARLFSARSMSSEVRASRCHAWRPRATLTK